VSFSENPFKVLRVVVVEGDKGGVRWNCDGCGGGWRNPAWPVTTPVSVIMEAFHKHIIESHQRTPESFADYSGGE